MTFDCQKLEGVLTVAEVAEELSVSKTTVVKEIRVGRLAARKVFGVWAVPLDALKTFQSGQQQLPMSAA